MGIPRLSFQTSPDFICPCMDISTSPGMAIYSINSYNLTIAMTVYIMHFKYRILQVITCIYVINR